MARRRLMEGVFAAQSRERDRIIARMSEAKGLMPLLMKHRNGDQWSGDERTALLGQLRALAHLSPYLVVMLLPGSFAVLPLLAWWLDRRRIRRNGTPARNWRP